MMAKFNPAYLTQLNQIMMVNKCTVIPYYMLLNFLNNKNIYYTKYLTNTSLVLISRPVMWWMYFRRVAINSIKLR